MKRTVYDSKNRIARIEPGSNWGLVYEALNPYGVAAVGGRAFPVGVGSFTTSGWVSAMLTKAICALTAHHYCPVGWRAETSTLSPF